MATDPEAVPALILVVQTLLQQRQDELHTRSEQTAGRTGDVSARTDGLQRNITDRVAQAEGAELEGENKTPASQKSRRPLIICTDSGIRPHTG
uniref:Uncharacterized protein n=1 Tax=Prolemur simus TaxID=1328070 RepID=A0A8C9DMW0_PROSS